MGGLLLAGKQPIPYGRILYAPVNRQPLAGGYGSRPYRSAGENHSV